MKKTLTWHLQTPRNSRRSQIHARHGCLRSSPEMGKVKLQGVIGTGNLVSEYHAPGQFDYLVMGRLRFWEDLLYMSAIHIGSRGQTITYFNLCAHWSPISSGDVDFDVTTDCSAISGLAPFDKDDHADRSITADNPIVHIIVKFVPSLTIATLKNNSGHFGARQLQRNIRGLPLPDIWAGGELGFC